MLIDNFTIGVARTIGDPCAVTGLKDGLERGNQTAGGNDHLDGLFLVAKNVHIRLAIRDHEKRLIAELVAQTDSQTLGGPDGRLRFA